MKILEQQDTGTCIKSLKIEVPQDDVNSELETVFKEFMTHASVPGFRRGKAPRKIVQMRFGKHLRQEAMAKAVESAFQNAVDELDVKPVNQPEISDVGDLKDDEPIVFEAKFEYVPPFELAEYKDIRPEPPQSEVSEKDVVQTLDRLRDNNAAYAAVEDRPVQDQDYVTISCQATIDGEPFREATHDEIPIQVGSNRYIPGFEDQLKGMNLEEEKTFTLTLPDEYPTESMRGKAAEFNVKIKRVQERRLPELDDEFARDMGDFESLADLKNRIREDLEANMEQHARDQLRQAIRDELVNRNQFPVPPSMVRGRYNLINAMQDAEFKRYGQSLESAAQQDEGLLTRNEETAEKEVRLSLVLDKIADVENLAVSDEDYLTYIAQMAQSAYADPATYLQRIKNQGMENYYRRLALEEKVIDELEKLARGGDEAKPEKSSAREKIADASEDAASDAAKEE
ncbi:MAG: trigger factor [bacterium]|nr:trigger factor [bacterium]